MGKHIPGEFLQVASLNEKPKCGCFFLYNLKLYNKIKNLNGSIVECGVGSGNTLVNWCLLVYNDNMNRTVWGFDSFQGFPEPDKKDGKYKNVKKGALSDSIAVVEKKLINTRLPNNWKNNNIKLIKGFFNNSLKNYDGRPIALLHLDCDLYNSYKDCLNSLYNLVVKGGVIMFDEYMGTSEHKNYPGAAIAINEFFKNKPGKIIRDSDYGKFYIIKE